MSKGKWNLVLSASVNVGLFGELLATKDWRSSGGWNIKLMLYRTDTHYICRRISYQDGDSAQRREQIFISPDTAGLSRFFGDTKIGNGMYKLVEPGRAA